MYNFEICTKVMNIPFTLSFYLFYLLPLLCAIILFSRTPCWLLASCAFLGCATGIIGGLPSQELLPQGGNFFFTPWCPMTLTLYEPPPSSIFSSQLDGALHNLVCSFLTSQLSAGDWTTDFQGSFPVLLGFALCFYTVRLFQSLTFVRIPLSLLDTK